MAYRSYPLLVFGFHGCSRQVASRVIAGEEELNPSRNDYDWLGEGIYFWENAPERALQWAVDHYGASDAAVVGAVIQLSSCLNLMDKACNAELRAAYDALRGRGVPLPKNKGGAHYLDKMIVQAAADFGKAIRGTDYDAVRGAFIEGEAIYPGASIMDDTHIQLCVRNPKSIIAYFHPRGI